MSLIIKNLLELEQQEIMDANNDVIVVSACPGSGKTNTIARKIVKFLEKEVDKSIIALSFNKDASKQLISRIQKLNNNIMVRAKMNTLDAFVKNFIQLFVGRYFVLKDQKYDSHIFNDFQVIYRNNKFNDYLLNNEPILNLNHSIHQEWIKIFLQEKIYIFSPTAFLIAADIIREIKEAKDYLKMNYNVLYVDEAQDLNVFHMYLIKTMKEICNFKLVLVGDQNQCINQFIGSAANLFIDEFKNYPTYKLFKLNHSIRCHNSIFCFSYLATGKQTIVHFQESRVHIIEDDLSFLKNNKNRKFLILADENKICDKKYDEYKGIINISRHKKIELNDKYKNYQYIFDEVLMYFYNWNNTKNANIYSLSDFIKNLPISEKNKRKISSPLFNQSKIDYIKYILKEILEYNDESFIYYLQNDDSFKKEENFSYYWRMENTKIMTIHISKGLENNDVLLLLPKKIVSFDQELKNKLFVAFTRAKDNLYIKFLDVEKYYNNNSNRNINLELQINNFYQQYLRKMNR